MQQALTGEVPSKLSLGLDCIAGEITDFSQGNVKENKGIPGETQGTGQAC